MGEIAVVTGASSGIGEAFAERLASDGWDLIVVARREERLAALKDRLESEHGIGVAAIGADLALHSDLERVCAVIAGHPVGMLVNNAALAHYMPFADLQPERAEELVHLDVLAPVVLTRAVIPGMLARHSGSVVNVASLLAFSASADNPHLHKRAVYAASKSFLVTFSRLLDAEVRADGVRVQVLCPGVVRSEFHTRQGMDMSRVPRMEAADVVRASLLDLHRGEVVCIPGLADTSMSDRVDVAQDAMMGAARVAELPERYAAAL